MRKKLEDETNRRTKEQNNHHVVSERITNLEKEKRDLADRLKKENENMEKLKKANAELSIAKTASGEFICSVIKVYLPTLSGFVQNLRLKLHQISFFLT